MPKTKLVFYVTGEGDDGSHFKHDWSQVEFDTQVVNVESIAECLGEAIAKHLRDNRSVPPEKETPSSPER